MKSHGENPNEAGEDDPAQSKRFVETARSLGADESGEFFMNAISIVAAKKLKEKKSRAPIKHGNETKKPAK